jgi:hypothetical protein
LTTTGALSLLGNLIQNPATQQQTTTFSPFLASALTPLVNRLPNAPQRTTVVAYQSAGRTVADEILSLNTSSLVREACKGITNPDRLDECEARARQNATATIEQKLTQVGVPAETAAAYKEVWQETQQLNSPEFLALYNSTPAQLAYQRCKSISVPDRQDECRTNVEKDPKTYVANQVAQLGISNATAIAQQWENTQRANQYVLATDAEVRAQQCSGLSRDQRDDCAETARESLLVGLSEEEKKVLVDQRAEFVQQQQATTVLANYQSGNIENVDTYLAQYDEQYSLDKLNTLDAEYKEKCTSTAQLGNEAMCSKLAADIRTFLDREVRPTDGTLTNAELASVNDQYLLAQCKQLNGRDCSTADTAKASLLALARPELQNNPQLQLIAQNVVPYADERNQFFTEKLDVNVEAINRSLLPPWLTHGVSQALGTVGDVVNNLFVVNPQNALIAAGRVINGVVNQQTINLSDYSGLEGPVQYAQWRNFAVDEQDTAAVRQAASASLQQQVIRNQQSTFYNPEEVARLQVQAAQLGIDTTSDAEKAAAAADPLYWTKKAQQIEVVRMSGAAEYVALSWNQTTGGRFKRGIHAWRARL